MALIPVAASSRALSHRAASPVAPHASDDLPSLVNASDVHTVGYITPTRSAIPTASGREADLHRCVAIHTITRVDDVTVVSR